MSERIPQTEAVNPLTAELDALATPDLVALLVSEQQSAVEAVRSAAAQLAAAVDAIAARLERGGRLHYVGAGTSGRLGVLDAAEMPPTFGTSHDVVCAHIAGGAGAVTASVEGAEDDGEAGETAIRTCARDGDAVVGISASGGAAFVVRAIAAARRIGAYTVAISGDAASPLVDAAECAIVLPTGAEPVAGSTRMKAGTAQKIALNTLSTAVMVRLGKTYGNLMVDVIAVNEKLRGRALRLVCTLAGVDETRARELLGAAGGRVKVAVVMERRNVDAAEASAILERSRGFLRAVL
ncbi:MAG: N-acetylmuramic acid 6-phosphate etherase [Candidatus Eremiobacteraeota bacterium]|nr:N-acetylmuramic acid 6-phosphate etherase [Candidatus Eremiobacteraeota bacterium]MBV8432939.1 N-acetylmuramic acid 6-phosphate etherase [Candidatus Eremiobacteraeota bacterium]